ncbi:hypothetical protein ACFU9Y_40940, partial [Streptomyces sp. NPDC057621]
MASSPTTSSSQSPRPPRPPRPNLAFRRLRGQRSPGEFAAAVRRAAREIDERVSCDARYIGRVEAGEIRCPNYAYERVFLHMFPGRTLTDLGFVPRSAVRGRGARTAEVAPAPRTTSPLSAPRETDGVCEPYVTAHGPSASHAQHAPYDPHETDDQNDEESDVQRRAFMSGGTATVAAASLGPWGLAFGGTAEAAPRSVRRAGEAEAGALEEAVRKIRVLDDRHGADGLLWAYLRCDRPHFSLRMS